MNEGGTQLTDEKDRPKPLFDLGHIVGTPGALDALQDAGQDPGRFLLRHVTGDWGDLDDEDKRENALSVQRGFRVFSAYELSNGVKIWLITEADRSCTTYLLPSEY
jgi:hypothetical protein